MNNKIRNIIAIFFASVLAISCEKKYDYLAQYNTDIAGTAQIKVVNATTNAARNYVYLGNTPLTGTALAYGGIFPAGSGSYASIPAGASTIIVKDTLATSLQVPVNFNYTFDAGKQYSIFTYDTTASTKYKVVQDVYTIPTDTSVSFRFANFFYSAVAVPAVDIYSVKAAKNIATNLAVADVTAFANHLYRSDSLWVRNTGTTTNLMLVTYTVSAGRCYTWVLRGKYQNTGAIRTIASVTNY